MRDKINNENILLEISNRHKFKVTIEKKAFFSSDFKIQMDYAEKSHSIKLLLGGLSLGTVRAILRESRSNSKGEP